jgi:hypothetical protein
LAGSRVAKVQTFSKSASILAGLFHFFHNFFDDIQQFYGLKSDLLPTCLNLSFHLDELKTDKMKRITTLLNELSE